MSAAYILAIASVTSVLISIATLVYTMANGHQKKTYAKMRGIEDALAKKADVGDLTLTRAEVRMIEGRVTVAETDIKHLPDGKTANRLELGLTGLTGQVNLLAERIKASTATLERVQEALDRVERDALLRAEREALDRGVPA
jgi:hypothetical protein